MTAVAGVTAVVDGHLGRGVLTGLVGVVGLLVGSFLNVVIYRVPRHLSVVEPRSFCPHCDTPVRSLDNIPVVSWAVLRGRCRQCRGSISIRYPLVELATGVVFAAIGWGLGPHWAVGGFCVLAATLVALVAIERDGLAPPLSIAAIGTSIGVLLLVAAGTADHRWHHVVGVIIGIGVAVGLAAVKFPWTASAPTLLPVGAVLGWLGPTSAAEGLVTTAAVLVAHRLARKKHRERPSDRGILGVALAIGVATATVIAVTVTAGVGR